MRLGAVTVCVHESDSLAAALPNRDQVDRWLVITAPSDRDTIAFCRGRGLECRTSETLEPRGGDPLGESDRMRAIEEERAALGPGWTATISSFVLLPRWFRACIEAETLDPRRRYFLAGLRRGTDWRMAERLKWCEPWRPDAPAPAEAERLFALSHLDAAGSTDGPGDRLAMTALLLGEGALAWGAGIHASERLPDRDLRAEALRAVLAELGPDPSVLVAGCYLGMKLELWAQGCAHILVSDDFGLHGNAALCALWQANVADLANLTALDAFNAPTVLDRSVDLLYLPGEASAERFIAAMPFWRRVLKRNALVCGDLYGWADWQAATQAVAQVFGVPDRIAPSGFWQRRFDPAWLPGGARAADGRDVIILDQAGGDPERMLVSLHALRQHWRGPVTVERADPADDRIALACARYGATLRSADAAAGRDSRADRIVLRAGTLVTGPVAGR